MSTLTVLLSLALAPVSPADRAYLESLGAIAAPPPAHDGMAPDEFTPGPGASDGVLLDYWCHAPLEPRPAADVLERLLAAAERQPARLPVLVRHFEDAPGTHERIARVYERHAGTGVFTVEDERQLHGWLMGVHPRFTDDLVNAATTPIVGSWEIENEWALRSLAGRSWRLARPIVDRWAADDRALVRAVANVIGLEHAIEAGDRDRVQARRAALRTIAEDPGADGRARSEAIAAVMATPWDERDDWFRSLFTDRSLRRQSALQHAVAEDPDRLIPIVRPMIGDVDPVTHNLAVACLLQFNGHEARADAIEPLLPCLMDPDWARLSPLGRLRVVQSLDRVHLPRSVPGLLHVVATETGYMLAGAADALATYQHPDSVAVLRAALERETEDYPARQVIAALVTLHGFTLDEMADGFLTYAGARAARSDLSAQTRKRLGRVISDPQRARADVAAHVLQRIDEVAVRDPVGAHAAFNLLACWRVEPVDRAIMEQLAGGHLAPAVVKTLLEDRDAIRTAAEADVRFVVGGGGLAGGIAAACLDDPRVHRRLLEGDDDAARLALLEGARLGSVELPIGAVAACLDAPDAETARAAEAYLEANDGPSARAALLARHPGEALVLGWGGRTEFEEELRERVLSEDGPDEIYALLTEGGNYVIDVRDGHVRLVLRHGPVDRVRALTDEELQDLRRFIAGDRVEDLGPFLLDAMHGDVYVYLHVTPEGGRRIYMNTPQLHGPCTHAMLVDRFHALGGVGEFDVRYDIQDEMPGIAVVLSDRELPVRAIQEIDGQLAVLVGDGEYGEPTWRWLRGDVLGKAMRASPVHSPRRLSENLPDDLIASDYHLAHPWQLGGERIVNGHYHCKYGLWRCAPGAAPEPIVVGSSFGKPVGTPRGLLVCAMTQGSWAEPNGVVVVDPRSGVMRDVPLPPADDFDAVAWVAAHQRVLLYRDHVAVLLDPESLETQEVSGDFGPWFDQSWRPLQPTGRPNEVWATDIDWQRTSTQLGRYDTRRFEFTPVLTLPTLRLHSADVWVHEREGVVYVVTDVNLLRIPLLQLADAIE